MLNNSCTKFFSTSKHPALFSTKGELVSNSKGTGKVILISGCGSPYGCETLRLPHFLDNQQTDDGEVVSLTCWSARHPTPRKIPGTHFCYRLCRPQGHIVAGRIKSIEKSNDLTGNRTCNLLACSTVPQ
jgi:hypothetical protein